MNAEAVIQALLANLGDPHKLAKRAEEIEVPQVSKRALERFKKRFVLLGQAVGAQRIVNFLQRLQDSLAAEKAANQKQGAEQGGSGDGASLNLAAGKEAPANSLSESQYHGPSGFQVRSQSAYPGSINPSMSFGGTFDVNGKRSTGKHGGKAPSKKPTRKRATGRNVSPNEGLESRLNARFDTLGEDFGMGAGSGDATIEADKGRFVVDGQVVMSNGADILKALAMWLIDNEPGVMQRASEELGNMVRKGELFRT